MGNKWGAYAGSAVTDITLYVYARNPQDHERVTSVRVPLKNVFFNPDSNQLFRQTGVLQVGAALLQIPAQRSITGRQYTNPHDPYVIRDLQGNIVEEHPPWYSLTTGQTEKEYWTIDTGRFDRTRVVRGHSDVTFEWGTEQMLALQFKPFNEHTIGQPRMVLPRDVNTQLFGSPELHFVAIRI